MRKPGFYFIKTDPDPQRSRGERPTVEREGFVCRHCGKAVWVPPMCDPAEVGGRCYTCTDNRDPLSGLICPACVKRGGCEPFEEALRRVEARELLFTDIGRK